VTRADDAFDYTLCACGNHFLYAYPCPDPVSPFTAAALLTALDLEAAVTENAEASPHGGRRDEKHARHLRIFAYELERFAPAGTASASHDDLDAFHAALDRMEPEARTWPDLETLEREVRELRAENIELRVEVDRLTERLEAERQKDPETNRAIRPLAKCGSPTSPVERGWNHG
jgi:regulator of replication initiation timing